MQPALRRRPRVARETRLLLATALVAVVALSIFARLRSPARTMAPAAVGPILAPLLPRQGFADLAGQLTDLRSRIGPRLVSVMIASRSDAEPVSSTRIAALRIRSEIAVALLPPGSPPADAPSSTLLARDPATGFAVLRVEAGAVSTPATEATWADRGEAGYLMTSAAAGVDTVLVPMLVPGTARAEQPLWAGEVVVPIASPAMSAGSFVFTSDGDWVGLVATTGPSQFIVPAPLVMARADQLLASTSRPRVVLGVGLQPLTPSLARAAGATAGVMVRSVEAQGPADGRLRVGDVLESLDGRALPTWEHWQRALTDLRATAPIRLVVDRGGALMDVEITPTPEATDVVRAAPRAMPLGWRLAAVRNVGTRITALPAGSRAERAGLRVGDVITMIGATSAPTPTQLRRVIETAAADRPLLVALRRGDENLMLAMEP